MLSVPGARVVRGYSFIGDSFVYVLFDDGTDLYWARSRVLEYLSQVQGRLPRGRDGDARPGRDRGRLDLRICAGRPDRAARPRAAAQHPGLVPALRIEERARRRRGRQHRRHGQAISGRPRSAEARRLRHHAGAGDRALKRGNQEAGGSVVEMAEAEYIVRATGYLKTLDDFRAVPLKIATAACR